MTTKFLWLKVKQPIIIYDSQAKKAILGNATKVNYSKYYKEWRKKFNENEEAIKRACENLGNLHLYLPNQRKGLQEDIQKISQESWFHERVFDTYLWNKGQTEKPKMLLKL